MPGLLAAAAPAVISGVAGFFGQRKQNKTNEREAQKNRDFSASEAEKGRAFSERMRNTEWQAGLADMEAAGINPALAYSQGGASAPTGATASGTSTAPAGNETASAMQAIAQAKQLKILGAQADKARAEAGSARAQERLDSERSNVLLPSVRVTGGRGSAPPLLHQLVDSEVANATHGATNMRALARRNAALADIAGPMAGLSNDMGRLLPILAGLTTAAQPSALARSFLRRRIKR